MRWRARKLTSELGPGEDPRARPAPHEKDVNREGVDDLGMDRPQPLNAPLIGDPDDQEPGFSAHLRHAVRGDQHRFGRYPGQLLDDQGGIGQQAGGVPVPCQGLTGAAQQPDGCAMGTSDPSGQFQGRPVLLGASEGDRHRPVGADVGNAAPWADQARALVDLRMNIIVNDRTDFPHLAMVLVVMAAISGILLRWAKRQGWL